MRTGFDAAGFQSPCHNERVHSHAGHRAAIDVDGVDAAGSHDVVDLLVNALERDAFGRIDLHADGEFLVLQFFPELAFRLALGDGPTHRMPLWAWIAPAKISLALALEGSTDVFQWGTFVHREHRGHRLGLPRKAVTLRAI